MTPQITTAPSSMEVAAMRLSGFTFDDPLPFDGPVLPMSCTTDGGSAFAFAHLAFSVPNQGGAPACTARSVRP